MGGRAEEESFWAEEWEAGAAGSRVIPRHLDPSPVPVRRVAYGPAAQHFAELRLPTAESAASRARSGASPVAVFVHGGFWKSEWALDLESAMADDLARRGWASWNIEYRRVGYKANGYEPQAGAGWPGTFQDVVTALDKLADVATEVAAGGDAALDLQRVVLIGHSAGGHLALWLAQVPSPHTPALYAPPVSSRGSISTLGATHQCPRRRCFAGAPAGDRAAAGLRGEVSRPASGRRRPGAGRRPPQGLRAKPQRRRRRG